MLHIQIGQRVHVDLFGLRHGVPDDAVPATVVGLAPGVITVRVDEPACDLTEVTVSPGRIQRREGWA